MKCAVSMLKRLVPLLLLCGLLSGCMVGWESQVSILRLRPVLLGEIVAAVSGINGLSVVSTPPKHLSEGAVSESIDVRRGKIVAYVLFPTPLGRKDSSTINIGTYSRSAEGKTFVKDLADALQEKFGPPSFVPQIEPIINDGGP